MNRPRTIAALHLGAALIVALAVSGAAGASNGLPAASDHSGKKHSERYLEGHEALEAERWDEAARIFAPLASGAGPEAEAALYWKAYADGKAKRKKEALEALSELQAEHPDSPWADDARALALELRGGKSRSAESASSDEATDELKLYALDGLMQVDSEKAVPVLERLLAGDSSLTVKQRALFVLSQSDAPRAREILLKFARAGQPDELRREAVRTLAIAGDARDLEALATLAKEPNAPLDVREAVVEAYMIADRPNDLARLAKGDPDARIRRKAIEALGAMDALPALRDLWASERDPELKKKLLEAFGIAEDVPTLARIARESSDPEIRRKAVEGLSIADTPASSKALRQLYSEFTDVADRRKVLEGFMIQGDAETLVALFRSERDPALKKAILQQLSVMDDPEATKVLLDVLGEKP